MSEPFDRLTVHEQFATPIQFVGGAYKGDRIDGCEKITLWVEAEEFAFPRNRAVVEINGAFVEPLHGLRQNRAPQ